ncbi:hypothetical protein Gotri_005719 [Gossypium trilobum]|uniref:Uncharacterized protein n=1 Tax=Gossypium trilobum TaxID=34281 RepID=A0A7J9EXJ1_9ROSI|nr:hypothetical protein [Gossypium trilobum]
MLGYGCGMTKSKLFSYGSVTRGSQSTSAIKAKFMDMMDAREKKHRALFNECMAKGMSNKYKAFHSKHSKVTIL